MQQPRRARPLKMEVKTREDRAWPRHPVPCLTFAFSRKKNVSRKRSGHTRTSSSLLRGRAVLSCPVLHPAWGGIRDPTGWPRPTSARVCCSAQQSPCSRAPSSWGRGQGEPGAGSSGLHALGQGGPRLHGKLFPSETPNLGGLRGKITNEHFIDSRAITGRRGQTAVRPARGRSARRAINKNPAGSLRFMGRAQKTRRCPPGSAGAECRL